MIFPKDYLLLSKLLVLIFIISFLIKQLWSEVSNLKFTQKKFGKVHIEMRFISGENENSDGREKFLAWARPPLMGGDIFFDDENWSVDSYISFYSRYFRKWNLLKVATHELGHAVGIKHSQKNTALMAPGASLSQVGEARLDVDDIRAIQALYGSQGLPRPQVEDLREVDIETASFG